jgi:hypothetical protein
LPANFKSDWHNSGIEGVFAEPVNVVSIITYGALPDDGFVDDAALTSALAGVNGLTTRSEEHTSELQSRYPTG